MTETPEITRDTTSLFDMRRLVPHSEEEYYELVDLLRMVLNAGGRHEGHSLFELVEAIGSIIQEYEDVHYPVKDFL